MSVNYAVWVFDISSVEINSKIGDIDANRKINAEDFKLFQTKLPCLFDTGMRNGKKEQLGRTGESRGSSTGVC